PFSCGPLTLARSSVIGNYDFTARNRTVPGGLAYSAAKAVQIRHVIHVTALASQVPKRNEPYGEHELGQEGRTQDGPPHRDQQGAPYENEDRGPQGRGSHRLRSEGSGPRGASGGRTDSRPYGAEGRHSQECREPKNLTSCSPREGYARLKWRFLVLPWRL